MFAWMIRLGLRLVPAYRRHLAEMAAMPCLLVLSHRESEGVAGLQEHVGLTVPVSDYDEISRLWADVLQVDTWRQPKRIFRSKWTPWSDQHPAVQAIKESDDQICLAILGGHELWTGAEAKHIRAVEARLRQWKRIGSFTIWRHEQAFRFARWLYLRHL